MADLRPQHPPTAAPSQATSNVFARWLRPALWLGVAFNLFVAATLAFPDSLGEIAAMPPVGSEFYRWMLVYFVVLFAATYGWLALQPVVPHALVGLASLGKAGVFVVALVCLLKGDIEGRTFALTLVDLAYALYFFAWMRATTPKR
jgi:hypothetical protein